MVGCVRQGMMISDDLPQKQRSLGSVMRLTSTLALCNHRGPIFHVILHSVYHPPEGQSDHDGQTDTTGISTYRYRCVHRIATS